MLSRAVLRFLHTTALEALEGSARSAIQYGICGSSSTNVRKVLRRVPGSRLEAEAFPRLPQSLRGVPAKAIPHGQAMPGL